MVDRRGPLSDEDLNELVAEQWGVPWPYKKQNGWMLWVEDHNLFWPLIVAVALGGTALLKVLF